ncbi:putative Hemolysin D [Beijerinckiaceae bacterium RH AL1]|nr:HlyD family type I secretion periplasmic adaptor subunit [Beijerinckiaceae bacterium]VVB44292.1 putative Hemolysin D [Beijerinckiaceae bacterium RH CH11]VVB44370.1 putative Hemolysin D [Beijerinckiaceae bacterium RH AL8]VVC54280.1 putative Hemolysin D [Beijerinckiaceae bacterium RH AL1]
MDQSRRGGPGRPEDGNLPVPRRRRDLNEPIERKPRRPLPDFTGMDPPTSGDARYTEFLPVAQQIVATPPSRTRRYIAYVFCGSIAVGFLWSIFGDLRLFAVATGEIGARGGNQVVQPIEPGQISAIPVQNGSRVEAGAPVLQLDPTAARADVLIAEAKLANARGDAFRRSSAAFLARSKVTALAAPLAWPTGIPADVKAREETVLRADLSQLAATLADLDAKLATARASIDKIQGNITQQKVLIDSRTKRTAMHQTLADQGWDSRAVVLQSLEPLRQDQVHLADYEGELAQDKAAIPVLEKQKDAAREAFIAENVAAAATAERETVIDAEDLKVKKLALDNLTLRAPVTGMVEGLAAVSLGQSIKTGETMMQIVPQGAPLQITAYVLNSDIGFVKAGQPATIKVDTFPYTRYGTISGKVVSVGADAIMGRLAAVQQNNDAATFSKGALSVTNSTQVMKDLVFPVTVSLDRTTMPVNGRDVPLTSGMSVAVEIETARRRAIQYILYPLFRVFERSG